MKRFFLIFTVFILLFTINSLGEVEYHDSISDLHKSLQKKPEVERSTSMGYRTPYIANCGEYGELVRTYRINNFHYHSYHKDRYDYHDYHYPSAYKTYPEFEKKTKRSKKYSKKYKGYKYSKYEDSRDYDSYYKGTYKERNVKSGYKRKSKQPYDGHPFKEYGWGQP